MLVWLLIFISDVQPGHALRGRGLAVLEIPHKAVVFLYIKCLKGLENPVVSPAEGRAHGLLHWWERTVPVPELRTQIITTADGNRT